jgi:hypothetical protein
MSEISHILLVWNFAEADRHWAALRKPGNDRPSAMRTQLPLIQKCSAGSVIDCGL